MGINEIYDLLKKYREHRCPPEEEERIARWYEQFDDDVENLPEVPEGKLEQLWFSIKRKIQVPWNRRVVVFYRYAVAIIILAMVGSSVIYFRGSGEPERQELTRQDILPAQGVAVLQLSDGREVPLNSTAIIQEQEGVVIKNDSSRVLDYTLATTKSEPLYNAITVPAGGEFRVLLSDGSSVRLNSCSALPYPVPFTGDVREVKLTGEAYFDVTKSDKPFIVKMADIDVRVLGTSFNVSVYNDENIVETALMEGKVKLTMQGCPSKPVYLTPSQKFIYSRSDRQGTISIMEGDTELAWKQGILAFSAEPLEEVFRKIERWYGVTMHYDKESLVNDNFTGQFKMISIQEMMNILRMHYNLKFKIENNDIYII